LQRVAARWPSHVCQRRIDPEAIAQDNKCTVYSRAYIRDQLAKEVLQRFGVQRGRACAHRIYCRLIHGSFFTLCFYTNWLVCPVGQKESLTSAER
jgi:hypothetical protein